MQDGPRLDVHLDIHALEKLSSVGVANDPMAIAAAVAEAGPDPGYELDSDVWRLNHLVM